LVSQKNDSNNSQTKNVKVEIDSHSVKDEEVEFDDDIKNVNETFC